MDNFKSHEEPFLHRPNLYASPGSQQQQQGDIHSGTTYLKFDPKLKKLVTWGLVTIFGLVIFTVLLVIVNQFKLMNGNGDEENSKESEAKSAFILSHINASVLQTEPPPIVITEPATTVNYGEMENRRAFVLKMAKESWTAYHQSAWGHSALRPDSKSSYDYTFGPNSGRSIIGSLSTLWIMELKEEFEQSKEWIRKEFNFSSIDWNVPVAESVSDFIGGLVSAYALTDDSLFKDKAIEIAKVLEVAYNSDTGLPYESLNPKSSLISQNSENTLSRIGGQSMEYIYLSDISSNPNLRTRVKKIQSHLKSMEKIRGLFMDAMNVENGKWTSSTTSLFRKTRDFYQTLVKSFLQGGKQDTEAYEMYKETIESAFQENPGLVQKYQNGLLYTSIYSYAGPGCGKASRRKRYTYYTRSRTPGHWHGSIYYNHAHEPAEPTEPPCVFTYKQDFDWNFMEYSSCYLGGMLALGAHASQQVLAESKTTDLKESSRITKHWEYAEALTKTCREASRSTKTGLGPEEFYFNETGISEVGKRAKSLLGPELAESYFILWRLTHDQKYRDYAWELTQAIDQHCKSPNGGYSTISDVDEVPTKQLDYQPPHFLSATLKYLYLTFSDDHLMPLEQWVFNAAGHPLPICGKNAAYPTKLCKV